MRNKLQRIRITQKKLTSEYKMTFGITYTQNKTHNKYCVLKYIEPTYKHIINIAFTVIINPIIININRVILKELIDG